MEVDQVKVMENAGRPAIKVNHPAPGDVVGDPVHVAGYGAAFEGGISLRVKDEIGTVVAEGNAQAGNAALAEYKTDLPILEKPVSQLGVIEVFEHSARDGAEINKVSVPVVFDAELLG